jgi:hypothetical protein
MNQLKNFLFVCENCGRESWLNRPQQMVACKCGSMQAKDAHVHRQPFRQNKLGIAYTSFQRVGGAETFLRTMMHALGPVLSGVAVLSPTIYSSGIQNGLQAIEELAAASETLLVWGFVEGLEALLAKYPETKIYAIHHGSLASTWANDIFAAQLQITGRGVAVNQDVASHFGVDWLPNPVLKPTFGKTLNTTGKPRILWNHRWSQEKRPDLAIAIAKALGDKVHFAISAPASIDLPPHCENIGQSTSNVNWLSGADVFLSTANQEAFGYSLAEAAYVGVPIVSSPYGIGTDIAVRVVDSDKPEVWAEAILATVGVDAKPAATWIDANHGRKAVERWATFVGADLKSLDKPIQRPKKANSGPGTELEMILKSLGVQAKIGCSCASIKNKMNQWGADGCLVAENHNWIVEQLKSNAEKYSWRDTIAAAGYLVVDPSLWSTEFLVSMAIEGWVEAVVKEAIRRSMCAESKKL